MFRKRAQQFRQSHIEAGARRALSSAGIQSRDERGSAIVYDYGLGLRLHDVGAVPGLLIQLEDKWVFAAERTGFPNVVYIMWANDVRDMRTVHAPRGVVLVVELEPGDGERVVLHEFLFAGADAESAALRTAAALAQDAGMADASGRPTRDWNQRVEEKATRLTQIGSEHPDPGIPSGLGYMQGPVPSMTSGAYQLEGDGEVISGKGSEADALKVPWVDVVGYWTGHMRFPAWFTRTSGDAVVLLLHRQRHGGFDLVVYPRIPEPWIAELRARGVERSG